MMTENISNLLETFINNNTEDLPQILEAELNKDIIFSIVKNYNHFEMLFSISLEKGSYNTDSLVKKGLSKCFYKNLSEFNLHLGLVDSFVIFSTKMALNKKLPEIIATYEYINNLASNLLFESIS